MPLTVAYNEDTKETMVRVGDQWQKAEKVAAGDAGAKAYLIGGKWLQDDAAPPDKAAALAATAGKPGPTSRVNLTPSQVQALTPGQKEERDKIIFGNFAREEAAQGAATIKGAAAAGSAIPATLAAGVNMTASLLGGRGADDSLRRFEQTRNALTYQPEGQAAQEVAGTINKVASAPSEGIHYGAEKTYEVTGSPLVGATVETLGNAALMAGPGGLEAARDLPASVRGAADTTRAAEAASAAEKAQAAKRAQEFTERAGVDWVGAAQQFKDTLTSVAKSEADLAKLDPKAVARVARAQAIGAPIRRGQATRDLTQITDEENIARTKAGETLRKKNAQQDTALHDELTRIREKAAPNVGAKDAGDVGTSLQGAARRKFQVLEGDYRRKYAEAEAAGELQQPVQGTPLLQWLEADPGNRALAGWIGDRIRSYSERTGGMTLKNMEKLRGEISAATGESGRKGFAAGEALRIADDIMSKAGGEKYQAARGAFKAVQEEFKNQGAIRDLTSEKLGTTDRRIALEDTLGRVMRGSNESLEAIKTTLTRGGTAATRQRGARAWRDLQAGVIEQLRDAAAGRRKIPGEDSQLQFNSAFLDELAKLEQGGKLQTLFGKDVANEIRRLGEATRDLRTTPADRVVGPQTALRVFRMMEKFSGIPGVEKLGKYLNEREALKKAATNPLEEAGKVAAKKAKPKTEPARGKAAAARAGLLTYQGDEQ